jgi:glycosyltransferase involved in cell wall biosynthesis
VPGAAVTDEPEARKLMQPATGSDRLEFATMAPGPVQPEVSVVVPIFNERDNLRLLHESLTFALSGLGRPYEIVLVDDGSADGSREMMRTIAAMDPHLRLVLFRRNYGQTAAMAAGFEIARGQIVVTMDGDLQNDPADIARLFALLDRGFDVACGWRRSRQDRMTTRLLPSRMANMLISLIMGTRIHDTGCSLKAYRAWVIRSLNLYSDMHRFMAALTAGIGARVTELPVRHHPRRHGRSKYGLGRVFRVMADLIVIKMLIQFAAHPLRWFIILALPCFLVSPVLLMLAMVKFPREGGMEIAREFDMPLAAGGAVTLLVALNVFLLGFLAELQVKVSRFFRQRVSVTAREASR